MFLIVLSACGQEAGGDKNAAAVEPGDRIECAIDGAQEWTDRCSIERGEGGALTLRHPGGGFRRLLIVAHGDVTSADGAEDVSSKTLADGRIHIMIGGDRYRLPKMR